MRWLSLFLLLLFLPSFAAAATLSGTIYTDQLEVASNVLVEIDSQPQQRLLSKDGAYSFELPPGNYTITLTYPASGENETTRELVVVRQEGNFTFDLFLFPSLEKEEELYQELSEVEDIPDLGDQQSTPWPLITLFALLLFILFFILRSSRLRKSFEAEDDRLEAILAILKKEGGRISQKELRKRLPESEAKISLMVAELEAKGKVEKIKKGRGNILLLKK